MLSAPPAPVNEIVAAGKLGVGSFAATAMAPSPVAGALTMYGLGPSLPAAATTMIPALAALVAAAEVGSSFEPNTPPSDMLMTSMSLSTAQSMPSRTSSVGPRQPNMRTAYRSAFGATPGPTTNVAGLLSVAASYGPLYMAPSAVTPEPAAVPATWEPCPSQSSGLGSGWGTGW